MEESAGVRKGSMWLDVLLLTQPGPGGCPVGSKKAQTLMVGMPCKQADLSIKRALHKCVLGSNWRDAQWLTTKVAPRSKGGDTCRTAVSSGDCCKALHTSRVCAYSVFAFLTAGSATAAAIVLKNAEEADGSENAANARES
jgi:hypothetical protein